MNIQPVGQLTGNLLNSNMQYEINENCSWSSVFGNDGYNINWSKSAEFTQDSVLRSTFSGSNKIWNEDAILPIINNLGRQLPIR
jgi:hypothetical protein